MLSNGNIYMESLAETIYTLCHDPAFVEECDRRYLNELEYNSMMAEATRKGTEHGIEQGRELGIKALILDNVEDGKTKEAVLEKLCRYFFLSMEDAGKYYDKFIH